jgi:hypothetical protein
VEGQAQETITPLIESIRRLSAANSQVDSTALDSLVRVGHPRESAWRKDLYDRFPWDWRQVAGAKNPFCRLVPCVPDFGVAAHAR